MVNSTIRGHGNSPLENRELLDVRGNPAMEE